MLSLSNFFQPLNPLTLLYFIGLFLFLDVIGTFIKNKILRFAEDKNSRIINWLIGFGFFVFLWFLLSLFITPDRTQILSSIGILSIITIPYYLKGNKFLDLCKAIWIYKVPILIIAPFLPAVFVKSSLPPYYFDEMAYHYIAPSELLSLAPIKYVGGLYADLPRILDLFWQLIFTLTNTYSIARLFHFVILASSMVYSYAILKKNFGLLPAFLFVFIFFSLPQDIVLTSTLGYIDVGAYSFLLIGLISAVDFLISKDTGSLFISSIFWAMNLGTKYTGVSSFISFLVIFLIILVWNRKEYFKLFSKKLIVGLVLAFIFFGGYWYVKNLIWFGNPIFPFLLPCFWGKHVEVCPTTGSFFGDWTMKINLANMYLIISQLFVKNVFLRYLVILLPFISLFGKNKKIIKIIYFSLLTVVGELLMLKHFSGFLIRYQQHMQLYLLLGVVLMLANNYKNALVKLVVKSSLLVLMLVSIVLYIYSVSNTNSLKFLNWNEINYSIGRITIYEWLDFYFPRMKEPIKWCENTTEGKRTAIARYDPDLIWFDYDGMMRVFLTNCYYGNPDLDPDMSKILSTAKKNKIQFWIASANPCIQQDQVKAKYTYERPDMVELRKLNNFLVCNSTEIKPYLYYFDYKNIKTNLQ